MAFVTCEICTDVIEWLQFCGNCIESLESDCLLLNHVLHCFEKFEEETDHLPESYLIAIGILEHLVESINGIQEATKWRLLQSLASLSESIERGTNAARP